MPECSEIRILGGAGAHGGIQSVRCTIGICGAPVGTWLVRRVGRIKVGALLRVWHGTYRTLGVLLVG